MKTHYIFPAALGLAALILIGVYFSSATSTESDTLSKVASSTPEASTSMAVSAEETTATTEPVVVPAKPPAPKPTPTPTVSSYTLAVVAQHHDASSCWTVVRGTVYDVTSWISKHPGGKSAILRMCGTDSTSTFVGQHEGERRPEAELASFSIGVLTQ